jgi:hypothetical protein
MSNDTSAASPPIAPVQAGTGETGGVVRFAVFRDRQGNRFVFPGVYDANDRSIDWVKCRVICAALGVEEEKERLSVVEDADGFVSFPHVKAEAGHRGFLHGGEKVWLIGGPEFDAITRATEG